MGRAFLGLVFDDILVSRLSKRHVVMPCHREPRVFVGHGWLLSLDDDFVRIDFAGEAATSVYIHLQYFTIHSFIYIHLHPLTFKNPHNPSEDHSIPCVLDIFAPVHLRPNSGQQDLRNQGDSQQVRCC